MVRATGVLGLMCAILLLAPVQATLFGAADVMTAQPLGLVDPAASTARPTAGAISFEANVGQADDEVRFVARGAGAPLFLTGTGAVMTVAGDVGRSAVALTFEGANPGASFVGLDPTGRRSSYLIGDDPTDWLRDVPHYGRVLVEDVYAGIDALYYGAPGGGVEYDLIIAPEADPAVARIVFEGARDVLLLEGGKIS